MGYTVGLPPQDIVPQVEQMRFHLQYSENFESCCAKKQQEKSMRPTLSMAGLPVCALCLFAFAAGVPSLAQDHHGNDKTAVTTTTTVASETEKKPVALP